MSSHVLWIVGGSLPLRGYRGPGPVRASVVLSKVLARSRGHTCRTLRGTGSVSSSILTIRKVPEWHVGVAPGATEVAVRAVLVGCRPLGAAVQRRPRKYSAVTGGLSCWPRGHVKEGTVPHAIGITHIGVHNEGRRARRREVSAQARDENPSARSQPANCPSEHSFFTGLGCDVVNKTTQLTSALSSPRWVP